MRLFVAIELPPAVIDAAARLVGELREREAHLASQARITWVTPERMHLTVQFIGEAAETLTRGIDDALTAPFDLSPFVVAFGGVGLFPAPGRPRVIWAGVRAGGTSLGTLQEQVASRLLPLGVRPDDRPFRPHLTLGRVREAAGLRADNLLEGHVDSALGLAHITHVTLFESRQGGGPPRYVVRRRTPLEAR